MIGPILDLSFCTRPGLGLGTNGTGSRRDGVRRDLHGSGLVRPIGITRRDYLGGTKDLYETKTSLFLVLDKVWQIFLKL